MNGGHSSEFISTWRTWYEQVEAELTSEHGFLSVCDLQWLDESPRRVPPAPGSWSVQDGFVAIELGPGEQLVVDGVVRRGLVVLPPPGPTGPVEAWHGRVLVEVAQRGERFFVRPRDPDHPRRARFTGTPTFPPDPRWRLTGVFRAVDELRTLRLPSVMPGLVGSYRERGRVVLEIGGRGHEFVAVEGKREETGRIFFRDRTSGRTTYAAGRFVEFELPPEPTGEVVVDFNRARSFPCSYTHVPTCPTAPAQNVVHVPIEAGARVLGDPVRV